MKKYTPVEMAQGQLDAYNKQDLNAFVEWYSEDVEVYEFPSNTLRMKGHAAFREAYAKRFKTPGLHAKVTQRMELGNFVIDYEEVSGIEIDKKSYVIAMYEISNQKISKVWFLKG